MISTPAEVAVVFRTIESAEKATMDRDDFPPSLLRHLRDAERDCRQWLQRAREGKAGDE
jgi:hypothetical protein